MITTAIDLGLDATTLTTSTQVLADAFTATEIWLYGSRARGDHFENSDWNYLIIADGWDNEEAVFEAMEEVREKLLDLNLIPDVTVVSQEEFETSSQVPNTLLYQVRLDRKLIWRR